MSREILCRPSRCLRRWKKYSVGRESISAVVSSTLTAVRVLHLVASGTLSAVGVLRLAASHTLSAVVVPHLVASHTLSAVGVFPQT
ncbi:MAG: hypothetical protein J6P84_05210 [Alphaproteobacteria bacterium]|nr:hypothetical protein [Alphaproteobacteria bacterium]